MFDDEITGGFDAADLTRRAKPQTPEEQLKAFLKTLPPEERRQYLANMRQGGGGQIAQRAPRAAAMADWRGEGLVNNAALSAGMAHASQGRHLQGMAANAFSNIQDENDRRVAISREMRRMEHERNLKKMEQETERMKIDALLRRLRMESGPRVSREGLVIY